jgi:CRISPR-associated protein Cas1
MSRKDHTLCFVPTDEAGNEGQARYIPIHSVSDFFVFGSLDANSALYNFLGKNGVSVHFFDYYEHYTGSFMAKEYLLAGKMQVDQTKHYLHPGKRMVIARKFVEGAAFNMLKNLRYYHNRDKPNGAAIEAIEGYVNQVGQAADVPALMGLEGNIRQCYYSAFETIVPEMAMNGRSKQPPQNEINALISFGNMLCYSVCLSTIYHTQLNPTISFLHEPGVRRYSLALDVSEVFKPLLVDRAIFKLVNKKEISVKDFSKELNGCLLKESGRKIFVKAFEERLNETIKHRTLGRNVSYKHLVKLECYKLSKHLLGIEEYKPFKAWW